MAEVILHIENLSKIFEVRDGSFFAKKQKLHALNNVTIDLYKGETLGVIGESGCGSQPLASASFVYTSRQPALLCIRDLT